MRLWQLSRPGFTSLLCHCLTVLLWASTSTLSLSNGKKRCHHLPCRAVVKTESKVCKEKLLGFYFMGKGLMFQFNIDLV